MLYQCRYCDPALSLQAISMEILQFNSCTSPLKYSPVCYMWEKNGKISVYVISGSFGYCGQLVPDLAQPIQHGIQGFLREFYCHQLGLRYLADIPRSSLDLQQKGKMKCWVLGHFCSWWVKPGQALPKTMKWMCLSATSGPGPPFIKTPSYGYRNPHYKPKMVWRPSQVYNGNPYIDEMVSF